LKVKQAANREETMSDTKFSFQRYEKKYLLDTAQYDELRHELEKYMTNDDFAHSTICNVYYDTPDFSLVRASLERPIYKEKLRVRSYGTPDRDGKVFLEIKKKYDGVVYKRRTEMTDSEAVSYLKNGIRPADDSQIMREIDWFVRSRQLEPKVYIAYDRDALKGIENDALRITFDHSIRWRERELNLCRGDVGEELLPEDTVLMEVKIPGAAPLWMAEMFSRLRIYPTNFSKYGACYKTMLARGDVADEFTANEIIGIGVTNCA
jgi:hypothetical protein